MTTRERPTAVFLGSMLYDHVPRLPPQLRDDYRVLRLRDDAPADEVESALASARALVTMRYRGTPPAPRLRLLQVAGAGIDGIELSSLPPGTTVCNAYGHEIAVAEYAVLVMLLWRHALLPAIASFRAGSWAHSSRTGAPLHHELRGCTVGIVGLGRIGRELASRARALGCRVIACTDHLPCTSDVDQRVRRSELPVMLAAADFVVVCCRLTPRTRGLVDASAIAAMRSDAVLVNVARGECVDEDALYRACADRSIGGAVLDVWYAYPGVDDPAPAPARHDFAALPNVIMTPHCAAWTAEMLERRLERIADNLARLARGQPLLDVVREGRSHAQPIA